MSRGALVRIAVGAVVTAGVVLAYLLAGGRETTHVKVGDPAPDLELPFLEGGHSTRLSAYRGRPMLLALFLSDCHICEAEAPEIERVHREFLPRGLVVVGVAVDPDPDKAREFVRRHSLTFLVLADPGARVTQVAYGTLKFPEAYLIDAGGTVAALHLGSVRWRSLEVRNRIQHLLPEPRPLALPR